MTPTSSQPRSLSAFALRLVLLSLGLGAIAIVVLLAIWFRQGPAVTIGVEGQRIVEIPGPQLIAVPFTPGDALSVRIANVEPVEGGFRYDLRYMAFGPGEHDIGKSLVQPNGQRPEPRPEFAVSMQALIPEKYSGELYATPNSEVDLHTNYSFLMFLAWSSWALLLIPLVWYGRDWRRSAAVAPPPPSITERLRLLLQQASRAELSPEQQADLEQLLLAFWSQRLNLSTKRLGDAVEQLRCHPQAGAQWSSVERWFHSHQSPFGGKGANGTIAKDLLRDLEALN
ncbi:hypothetical protein ETAA8_48450 [Anatilimnocola aggregata]|uniref:Uncharacterized protein n=1 Tax=Anatilimnocola aggregata TaxID=2528021 RepID=A0A517YHL4_9BACT|nr:hypothetical protein [Anatilimnocola aggregata]QDU29730.1 hypothetical protein ETAA8_48450 [Anatilimnocola aggregata]